MGLLVQGCIFGHLQARHCSCAPSLLRLDSCEWLALVIPWHAHRKGLGLVGVAAKCRVSHVSHSEVGDKHRISLAREIHEI